MHGQTHACTTDHDISSLASGAKKEQKHQMRVPTLGCQVLQEDSKSKKGHNSEKKKHFEMSPLIVCIALWIV